MGTATATHIIVKKLRRFRFVDVDIVNPDTGKAESVRLREIDGVLLVPVSESKLFTTYGPRFIKNMFSDRTLTPYFDNGEVCQVRRRGGKQLFFDLYEYMP